MEKGEYGRMFRQENDFWWYIILQNLILSYLKTKQKTKQIKILDAGCGTGKMAELLSDFGEVFGIDFSPEAIQLAKERKSSYFFLQDLNTWVEDHSTFDIIVCTDVLYHQAIKSEYKILTKFHNALKVGGILITDEPAFNILKRDHDNIVHGIRRYRKKEFLKMMNSIGFREIIASYRLPHLFLIILSLKFWYWMFQINNQPLENKPISSLLNKILILFGKIENKVILSKVSIPFGSSLFLVCEKNSESSNE